jgi:NitT/TauT family transport system permease protein
MAITDTEVREATRRAAGAPFDGADATSLVAGPDQRAARGQGGLRRRAAEIAPAIGFLVLLGVGWQVMASIIHIQLLPGLRPIWSSISSLITTGQFFDQLKFTMERIVIGFAIVLVISTVLGIAMGRNTFMRRFLEPAVLVGLTIPALVWAFLCIIWFGIGLANPVLAVVLSASPKLIVNVSQGMRSIDADLVEMSHVFRFSRRDRIRYVWIPSLEPYLFSGARVAIAMSWHVVVLVEIFGLTNGVGYYLNLSFSNHDVAGVIAWSALFGVVMAVIEYGVFRTLERRVTRWRRVAIV